MLNGITPVTPREAARDEYERLYRQGVLRQWLQGLFGQPSRLLELNDVRKQLDTHGASHGGTRTVPIGQIRGSQGRSADFDAVFRPLQLHERDRWASIADCRYRGVPLPVVDLIQVADTYFVRDGHHRVSVARAQGQLDIEADVTVWHNAMLPEGREAEADGSERTRGFWQLPADANRLMGGAVAMIAGARRVLTGESALTPQPGS